MLLRTKLINKWRIIAVIGFLTTSSAKAQQDNIFPATGFAGIGITNPNVPLQVRSFSDSKPDGIVAPSIPVLRMGRNGTPNYSYNESAEFRIGHGGPYVWGSRLDLYVNGAANQTDSPDQHAMSWLYNGNVGIGTLNPLTGLQLGNVGPETHAKQISIPGAYNFETIKLGQFGNGNSALEFVNHLSTDNSYGMRLTTNIDNGGTGLQFQYAGSAANYQSLNYQTGMFLSVNGNVGIGTMTPSHRLEVNGDLALPYTSKILSSSDPANNIVLHNGNGVMKFATAGQDRLIIDYAGNIGIGTTPTEKLSVYGTVNAKPGVISLESARNDATYVEVGAVSTKNADGEVARIGMLRGGGTYSGLINFLVRPTNDGPLTEAMRIAESGNLLLGKTSQSNSVYRLDVNGKARVNEIVVNTTGADFVFEPDYKLPTLTELEQFIKANKHLPEIQTATEMVKNGVSLGELNIKLLQKVEELTLHLIEKDKALAKEQEKNQLQEERILRLETLMKDKK